MTTNELAALPDFEAVVAAGDRPVTDVYCADLLSWAMGKAPEGGAWCTVMGNVNAVAVAALTDTAVLVLCEGAALDPDAAEKARQQDINIVKTSLPAFRAGAAIAKELQIYGF